MTVRVFALAIASLLVGVAQADTVAVDSTPSKSDNTPRSLSAIQNDVHAALRNEASSRGAGDNRPQVFRLIELYREMAGHPQHDKSFLLRDLGQQVRARLIGLKDHINRRTAQRRRKEGKLPATLAIPEKRVLAQQLPAPAKPVNQAANQPGPPPANAQGGGRPVDYGPDLVALIEATISPDTWNINGGPGAIIYYSPLRAIVVGAPDDVHEKVGGALGQFRAAQ